MSMELEKMQAKIKAVCDLFTQARSECRRTGYASLTEDELDASTTDLLGTIDQAFSDAGRKGHASRDQLLKCIDDLETQLRMVRDSTEFGDPQLRH